jgi:hypothetical protein
MVALEEIKMLYHNKCMSTVYIDATEGIRVLSYLSLSPSGLRTGVMELAQLKKEIKLSFYCIECQCQVPFEDIVGICGICGEQIPALSCFITASSGGVYCEKNAIEVFGATNIISLKKFIETGTVKLKT